MKIALVFATGALLAATAMVQHGLVDIAAGDADLLAVLHIGNGTAAYGLFVGDRPADQNGRPRGRNVAAGTTSSGPARPRHRRCGRLKTSGWLMDRDQRDADDDLVRTPGGPAPRSSTHRVPPGGGVRQEADGSFTVVGPPPGPMPQGSTPMPDDLVLTPGGYRDPALVHHVALDTVVDSSHGRLSTIVLAVAA